MYDELYVVFYAFVRIVEQLCLIIIIRYVAHESNAYFSTHKGYTSHRRAIYSVGVARKGTSGCIERGFIHWTSVRSQSIISEKLTAMISQHLAPGCTIWPCVPLSMDDRSGFYDQKYLNKNDNIA